MENLNVVRISLGVNCQTNKFKQVCLVGSCSSLKLYPTKMRNTFLSCLVSVLEESKLIFNKCVFDGDIENSLEANWILEKPLLAPSFSRRKFKSFTKLTQINWLTREEWGEAGEGRGEKYEENRKLLAILPIPTHTQ